MLYNKLKLKKIIQLYVNLSFIKLIIILMSRALLFVILAISVSFSLQSGFLTYVEPVELHSVPAESFEIPIPPQIVESVEFVNGLNEGLTFFNNLPHQENCISDNEKVIQDLVGIYEIVRHVTKDTDFVQLLVEVVDRLNDAYHEALSIKGDCQQWGQEAVKVLNGLVKYVSADNYWEKLTLHTITNIGKLRDAINEGINLVNSGNFHDGGKKFGEAVRVALFWDFKTKLD